VRKFASCSTNADLIVVSVTRHDYKSFRLLLATSWALITTKLSKHSSELPLVIKVLNVAQEIPEILQLEVTAVYNASHCKNTLKALIQHFSFSSPLVRGDYQRSLFSSRRISLGTHVLMTWTESSMK
jgi:hypothetical protein